MNTKLAVIGGGNIGSAITRGLLRSGKFAPADIYLTRRNISKLDDLNGTGINISNDNINAIRSAEVVLIAVLPNQMMSLLGEIEHALDPEKHILVSVVTAFGIDEIRQKINKNVFIVRAMPNIASAVGQSMTCLSAEDHVSEKLKKIVALFDLVGSTLLIDENLMSSATILGACGIAFFMRYIRAASQGGIQVGFHAADAQFIAAQTAKGATALLLESGNHPEREIDKVTTPMGCTIAGLNEMEHHGLSSALIKGIVTSYNEINKLK